MSLVSARKVSGLVLLACYGCAPSPVSSDAKTPAGASEVPVETSGVQTVDSPAATGTSDGPGLQSTIPETEGRVLECGALKCERYADSPQAFRRVLELEPKLLAIGESHKQVDDVDIPSATSRFASELLPLLEGQVRALVIEVMLPPSGCRKQERQVRRQQEEVTEAQDADNQNDFVMLATAAKSRGVTPYPLRPTCEDLQMLAASGDDGIVRGLELVADLFSRQLLGLLQEGYPVDAMLATYGGLIHNDLDPPEGREAWTFAPDFARRLDGDTVELDIIVPELIKDTPSWKRLSWYPAYAELEQQGDTLLIQTGPRAFALIFAPVARSLAR